MQIAIAVCYHTYMQTVRQTQSDSQYSLTEMYGFLTGYLSEILEGTNAHFQYIWPAAAYTKGLPTWAITDDHPEYGPLIATFHGTGTVSDWISLVWDTPDEWYRFSGESYSLDWLLEGNRCWFNVVAETESPPYDWTIYFYKLKYHFRDYYALYGNIIPALVPLFGAGVFLFFMGLSSGINGGTVAAARRKHRS